MLRIREGSVYHLKDEFYDMMTDHGIICLPASKGRCPLYCCHIDKPAALLWMIPIVANIRKYKPIHDKHVIRYGHCFSLVLGMFGDREVVYKLQDMFPVKKHHIQCAHTSKGKIVPVDQPLRKIIRHCYEEVKQLTDSGIECTFTDINAILNII